jgi:hypothetical protein
MNGWDYVSELRPPTGLLFILRVICESGEPWWWWWCRLGITRDSSTRALWQSYQDRHLGQVGGMDEGVRILPISIWNTSRDLLVLRHGTCGFTSHLKEGVLRILLPLRIHRLGRVWIRDHWVQWQAHQPLHHRGDRRLVKRLRVSQLEVASLKPLGKPDSLTVIRDFTNRFTLICGESTPNIIANTRHAYLD